MTVKLTVLFGKVSSCVHKLDVFVAQICQCSQILIFAIVREWIPALVAVVKMGQQYIGSYSAHMARSDVILCITKYNASLTKIVLFHLVVASKPALEPYPLALRLLRNGRNTARPALDQIERRGS